MGDTGNSKVEAFLSVAVKAQKRSAQAGMPDGMGIMRWPLKT